MAIKSRRWPHPLPHPLHLRIHWPELWLAAFFGKINFSVIILIVIIFIITTSCSIVVHPFILLFIWPIHLWRIVDHSQYKITILMYHHYITNFSQCCVWLTLNGTLLWFLMMITVGNSLLDPCWIISYAQKPLLISTLWHIVQV